MDEQVKRRLMGAGILSILAIIIVPYFFEDKAPKTATELPLPMDSQALALPKEEKQATDKPQAEAPVSPAAPQTQTSKKRTYTVVPLDDPKAQAPQAAAVPSEDIAQAPVAEEYPEEPVAENRGPVILDPKAPQTKPALTPKLQHPLADVPPARVATDAVERSKISPKKPEVVKPPKPVVPPVAQVAEAPVRKPQVPVDVAKKPVTAPATSAAVAKTPAIPASPAKPASPSSYLVQAGTFSDENNAKVLVEKLKKRSLPVRMQVVEGLNGKVYRVTVGPNLDHARAEQIQKQLSEQDGVRGLILQGR
ncbi:MAG: hypothetical protein RLZ25_1019 [Pseudomonadota bacterium]|jgi:DedD protein